jgi:hypothetical protein
MTTEELSRTDRDALRRAYATARVESEAYRDHLAGIEAREGWLAAAESSSYHLQVRNLRLRPWQCPPCACRSDEIGMGYGRSRGEVLLRKRMLEAGISLYEPDPASALEKIAAGAADSPAA